MKTMTRQDMDRWVGGGCAKEGCDHQEDTMFLHSQCHTDVPLMTVREGQRMGVLCVKCGKPLCVLGVTAVSSETDVGECCAEGIVWAAYSISTGSVSFTCYFCKKEVSKASLIGA